MLGRAFGTLAAITLGANAFLLPPGVNNVHSDSVDAFISPNTQSVKLPCPDCVFSGPTEDISEAEEGDDLFWVQGRDRAIVLNFTLTDDTKAVSINGWQIYPVTMDNPTEPHVAEVAATASFSDIQEHPEQATILDVSAAGIFVDEELVSPGGDKIVTVNYQIMSLHGQTVSVDSAEAKLLQSTDGSLMIISVMGVPKTNAVFDPNPFALPPPSPEKECNMLPAALCKWKSIVESKLGGFKQGPPPHHKAGGHGCGGRKGPGPHKLPGHKKPHSEHFEEAEGEERPKHHHGRPPHPHDGAHEGAQAGAHEGHKHHGAHSMHHGHHHGRHHFLHRFLRAFVSVLVPVIAGITMGMFVSVVGMATGRLIAFLWIKFRRGGQRGYASVAQTDAQAESMEKGAIDTVVVEDEPLPVYEPAPAYEEGQQKEQK